MFKTHPLLKKLLALKAIIWLLCGVSVVMAWSIWKMPLPYTAISAVLSVGMVLWLAWLSRLSLNMPLSHIEIAAILFSDIMQIGVLIYLTGGSSNPFTSSLLVPIAVGAALLPKSLSAGLALIAITGYSGWMWQEQFDPTFIGHPTSAATHHATFSYHILGMWLNFLASAFLLWMFVAAIAESLKKRENALRHAREKNLQNEQLIAVASLTAHTAHALSTPLTTMGMIIDEAHSLEQDDLAILQQQLNACKTHLHQLRNSHLLLPQATPCHFALNQLADHLRQHYQLMAPNAPLQISEVPPAIGHIQITADPSLQLAIINLIDNALQAASRRVHVNWYTQSQPLHWGAQLQQIVVQIDDDGPGIDQTLLETLGKPFVSTKTGGFGLGVFLSHATLERFNGKVLLTANFPRGTSTKIYLPWTSL